MHLNKEKTAELSLISKFAGQSEELVQAGGGNTSVKLDDNLMLIKASGFQLTEVTDTSGYSVVDYKKISDIFKGCRPDSSQEQTILQSVLIEGKKPSIETFLHSITDNYTIHTHPLGVSILACRKGGMEIFKQLFPNCVTVGCDTPGIQLANIYYDSINDQGRANRIFLKNHGLIVCANNVAKAMDLTTETIVAVNEYLKLPSEPYLIGCRLFNVLHKLGIDCIAYHCRMASVGLATELAGGAWDYEYSPDCVVYCSGKFLEMRLFDDFEEKIKHHIEKYGMPKIILVDTIVFIIAPTIKKAKEIESVLDFTARIYISEHRHTTETLTDKEIHFLLNWDSEKYRSSL